MHHFYLHRQYVYQMKAKNTPDKNLTWKNIICYEKFAKNWIFTFFAFSFDKIYFFITQIFRKILYTSRKYFFSFMCSTDDKVNCLVSDKLLTISINLLFKYHIVKQSKSVFCKFFKTNHIFSCQILIWNAFSFVGKNWWIFKNCWIES